MKKILVAIMACAFVLSFSGLTMAAEATPAAPAAVTPAPVTPAPAAAPATPAPVVTPAAPAKPALTADDIKWIAKCITDNKDEGQTPEVVKTYCECMNEKMDDNETQSVTQWEKKNPKEQKECSDKAGWK